MSGTNGALAAGEKIQVSSDGGATWTDVTQGTATTWSLVDRYHAQHELHLPGADRRCGRQCRHHRQPGRHHRHHGAGGGAGDHGDRRPTAARHGDFITNDTTLTVSGTNGALGAGEKIQVSSDGGATWIDVIAGHRDDLEL